LWLVAWAAAIAAAAATAAAAAALGGKDIMSGSAIKVILNTNNNLIGLLRCQIHHL